MNVPGRARTFPWRTIVAVLAIEAVIAAMAGLWLLSQGIAATAGPGRFETAVARRARHWAIPRRDRELANPVRATPESVAAGLAHFADHCAVCHGADGAGATPIGANLYPRAPDMSDDATQRLTDGELFFIIEHGVRLTGMPGWTTGTAEGARDSWHLVNFIRHLPKLTADERARIESLLPRSPEEWRQQQEEQEFLEGGDPAAPPHHHGDGHD